MSNLINKIKKNKLRTGLVGVSIFLFGFIAFQLSNNIGDTYAASNVCGNWVAKSLVCCPDSSFYVVDQACISDSVSESKCKSYGATYNKKGQCIIHSKSQIKSYKIYYYSISDFIYKTYDCATTYTSDECAPLAIAGPTRTGYTFNGWGTSPSCKSGVMPPAKMAPVTHDTSYYACWQSTDACYFCGGSQGGVYKWGSYSNGCSKQSAYKTQSSCEKQNPGCYQCGGGGSGAIYLWGKYGGNSGCSKQSSFATQSSCEAQNPEPVPQQTRDDFYIPIDDSTPEPTEPTESARTLQYYKIIYDLDGGKFIDGTTTRVQYVSGSKAVGTPNTHPIKDKYTFAEWRYNGEKFDFSQELDNGVGKNITVTQENGVSIKQLTLKAHYVEYDKGESEVLTCNSTDDILDAGARKCYSVLKTDSSKNIYTYTIEKYNANTRFCYANGVNGNPGGIAFKGDVKCPKYTDSSNSNTYCTVTGKNNNTTGEYSKYSGKDAWMSSTTCYIASPCTSNITDNGCEERWDSIIYNVSDAKVSVIMDDDSDEEENIEGQGGGNDSEPADLTDDEAKKIQTGDALIIVACILGVSAIGYTVYYFVKKKNPDIAKKIKTKFKKK